MPASTDSVPLTLITGDEDLLVSRAIAAALAAARAADPAAELEEYAAGSFTPEHVLELRNPPLFGGLRVVVVRGLNELTDEVLDPLLAGANDPIDEVVLIGVASGRERKQVAALRKLAGKHVVSAAKLTRPRDRRTFLMEEAHRHGARLTEPAAWTLLDAIGGDLRALSSAVELLVESAAAAPGRRSARTPIDEDAVLLLFRGRAETRGFAVADAIVAGDTATALSLLRSALETGTDPVPIVSAVAAGLRDLVRVHAEAPSSRGSGRGELARRLGMPDWKVEKAVQASRGWSDAALSAAMRATARADEGVKGGAVDPVHALERLVVEATSARNGRAALSAGGVRR